MDRIVAARLDAERKSKELYEALEKDLPPKEYAIPPPEFPVWQSGYWSENRRREAVERFTRSMEDILNGSTVGLGRHPTQDEVNAICGIIYKQNRTMDIIIPLSFTLGGILAYRGRATWRFPFYQPKFIHFDPSAYPTAQVPFIRGRFARAIWSSTRVVSYSTLSLLGVAPLMFSYTQTVSAATFARDERLRKFREDMKPERMASISTQLSSIESLRQQRTKLAGVIRKIEKQLAAFPTEEQITQRYDPATAKREIERLRQGREQAQKALTQVHEALAHVNQAIAQKEAGGPEPDVTYQTRDYDALSSSAEGLPSSYRPEYAPSQDTAAAETRPGGGWGQQNSGWGKTDSDGLDDDASPVAPAERSSAQSSSTPTGTGSAWERLRRSSQKPSRSTDDAWSQQNQPDSSATDYSYEKADAERASEKEKAQREFDAMLERERRGDGNSRW
ncbi:hypothetical protein CSOJ01_08317 [Colletotrichum sojae]|uniref:Uncharacterized protein n=1 Tax=Colletotrichum sojae TaxID=2175907 RepID=A0A8H6J614_9PEZI|nr:hypothetical protein CSOJ01_08317 [Colletotrichum sojae]